MSREADRGVWEEAIHFSFYIGQLLANKHHFCGETREKQKIFTVAIFLFLERRIIFLSNHQSCTGLVFRRSVCMLSGLCGSVEFQQTFDDFSILFS